VDANYSISYVAGTVTVTQAALTITASSPTVGYGSAVPTITPTYSGWVNGQSSSSLTTQPTCTTAYTTTSAVGSSPSTSCSGAVDANYSISYVAGKVTVTQAALTITASSPTVGYGGAVPTITPIYSGWMNGQSASSLTTQPTCTTTYTPTSAVGSSPSTRCSGAVDANYSISYVAGTVTVTQAPLTITASSPTVGYGGAVPTITPIYSGWMNGQSASSLTTQPTCTTTYTPTSAVGSSPSTSCSGAVDANYSISYVAGTVTVTQAALTITASSPTVGYGGAVPTITPIYSGWMNGQSASSLTTQPTCTTAYTTTSAVGSLPSTSCSGAVAANYSISYVPGTVTVTQMPLTITASSPTVGYGGAVPTITPSYSGWMNGQSSSSLTNQPTCTTAYTTTSAVGSSPSTSCSGAVDANYSISYVAGKVTVTQAPLTITASSPTVSYGGAVPTITPIYGGWMNGQSASSLTTQPTCTTAYTTTSAVGSSPSTSCSGAVDANYNISYVAGKVTVGKVTPTITWPAQPFNVPYNTASSVLSTYASTGGVAGTFTFASASPLTQIGLQTLPFTFTPSDRVDFSSVSGTITVTVVQATPIIVWNPPAAIAHGTALSATQLNAQIYDANSNLVACPVSIAPSVPNTCYYTPAANTVLHAGPEILTVTYTPSNTTDYTTVTDSVTLNVNKTIPIITWPTPASISDSAALSAVQLNAVVTDPTTGNVISGNNVYTSAGGTILTAGSILNTPGEQLLTVTFTPTDTADYAVATARVAIRVTGGAKYDTGTVTLTVGGATVAQYPYGQSDTPSTVAEGLAAHASGSLVTLTAVDDTLNIVAIQSGSASDLNYTLQAVTNDPTDFPQPSFVYNQVSGTLPPGTSEQIGYLDGGAAQNTTGATVYSYCVGQSCPVANNGYDPAGNLLGYTDSVMGQWGFTYDNLNRLITATAASASVDTAAGLAAPFAGSFGCWSYDDFGNRLSQSISTTPCSSGPTPMNWAHYNSRNQITASTQAPGGPTYDNSGDVTNDGAHQYLYDAEGRICAVYTNPVAGISTMTGYLYDADGTRIAKGSISAWSCDPAQNGFQTTNDYILGLGGEQLTEMGMGGTVPSGATTTGLVWQHANIWSGGKLLGTYDNDGLHFYLDDPLGTRRAQTNYAGVLEQTCQSLPYGDALTCVSQPDPGGNISPYIASLTAPTEHHFTGKERDTESGNDYFGARYYSSSMGRWLSPDWSAKIMPVPYAKLDNPQSLNLYAYVGNNPTLGIDSDGHREKNDHDMQVFEKLQSTYDAATGDNAPELRSALTKSATAIADAIDAVPSGQNDPASLRATEWGILQEGNKSWGPWGTMPDNGVTARIGPGINNYKCSSFVASAYGTGAGVGYGGAGFPIGSRSTIGSLESFSLRYNVLSAKTLSSNAYLAHLPLSGSAQLGTVVSFPPSGIRHPDGHTTLSIGGGAVVYAGPDGGKIQTLQYVQQQEGTSPNYRDYKP
jgi:RHS repeat-associated protein